MLLSILQVNVATNIFSKKATKRVAISTAPLAESLPNDEAALQERAHRRQQIDFEAVCFEVRNQTKKKYFERSFASLAQQHPHHEFLIKQLLVGAQLSIGNRIVAFQTHQDCYYGIEEFIDYLNSQGQPHHKHVRHIADIDFQITRNFSAYFLQFFPGRVVNRKRYGSLQRVVKALQQKYKNIPNVGEAIAWAQAPTHNDKPSESYSDEVFNQLVESSLTDVKFVMKMMKDHAVRIKSIDRNILDIKYKLQKQGTISGMSHAETVQFCSSLVAIMYPKWPLFESFEDAGHRFSVQWKSQFPLDDKANRKLFYLLTGVRVVEEIKCQSSGKMKLIDLEVGQAAYYSQFFFSFATLYPFILFVQINTGWNLEAVLNLSDDLDSHLQDDIVDPQYVVIYSSKERTQDSPFCRSNKNHPYSVYSILRFVQQQIRPFKDSKYYRTGYLWQAIATKNLWNKYGTIVYVADDKNVLASSTNFLKRHGIQIDSKAKLPTIESRRLRTTWETKRKEEGIPVQVISKLMSHDDIDTTVINYDSDSGSDNLRNKRLRQLQNSWEDDFRNYGAKLFKTTSLTQLREAIMASPKTSAVSKALAELGIDEKTIIHLLSPQGQTYIAACCDSKSPSWPGSELFVSPGADCTFFNRCGMCNQAVIFREALPFIVRRLADLDRLKTKINSSEWSSNYAEEAAAWEDILRRWKPSSNVEEAKKLAEDSQYVLPLAMRGA